MILRVFSAILLITSIIWLLVDFKVLPIVTALIGAIGVFYTIFENKSKSGDRTSMSIKTGKDSFVNQSKRDINIKM